RFDACGVPRRVVIFQSRDTDPQIAIADVRDRVTARLRGAWARQRWAASAQPALDERFQVVRFRLRAGDRRVRRQMLEILGDRPLLTVPVDHHFQVPGMRAAGRLGAAFFSTSLKSHRHPRVPHCFPSPGVGGEKWGNWCGKSLQQLSAPFKKHPINIENSGGPPGARTRDPLIKSRTPAPVIISKIEDFPRSEGKVGESVRRTLRSIRLRLVLWRRAGGKCQQCGTPLDPKEWHADHIVPWVRSGRTNVYEMQAL